MNTVKVNKAELLNRLSENRKSHKSEFLEAQKDYRDAAIKVLDQMLSAAREGGKFKLRLSMEEPVDHTLDYDREIEMLNMSVDGTIELQQHEFEQFVMDRWQWKGDFTATNAFYKSLK